MNTKQLDAVAELVGVAIAQALGPIKSQLETLAATVAALPAPEAVDLGPIKSQLETLAATVAALPAPRDGADGKSVTPEDVRPLIDEAVTRAVAALPPAPAGAKGADGVGLAGAMIDRDGALHVTLTDGSTKNLGVVAGVSFDGFDMEYLADTHEVRVMAKCAGRTQEIRYPAGGVRNRGYWRDGARAKAGDGYGFDGAWWIANADTAAAPSIDSKDWTLAARRGRTGEGAPAPREKRAGTVTLESSK